MRVAALLIALGLAAQAAVAEIVVRAQAFQGDTVFGRLSLEGPVEAPVVELIDAATEKPVARTRAFRLAPSEYGFLIGIASTLPAGRYVVAAAGSRGPLEVAAKEFPLQRIPLNAGLSELLLAEDPRKTDEARTLSRLLSTIDDRAVHHLSAFRLPVSELHHTSRYGLVREYLFADGTSSFSVHGGTDLALPAGSPVIASGSGKVVMARERIISGNTVVIEHLPGVYSLYYHLSDMAVVEGGMVRAGEHIGSVGSTGLATGAHLHWEVRVAGVAVDPEAFVAASQVDIAGLAAIMTATSPDAEGR